MKRIAADDRTTTRAERCLATMLSPVEKTGSARPAPRDGRHAPTVIASAALAPTQEVESSFRAAFGCSCAARRRRRRLKPAEVSLRPARLFLLRFAMSRHGMIDGNSAAQ